MSSTTATASSPAGAIIGGCRMRMRSTSGMGSRCGARTGMGRCGCGCRVWSGAAGRGGWGKGAEEERGERRGDVEAIRALLGRVEDWREEPLVVRWAVALCEAVGVAQLGQGFAKRLPAATGNAHASDQQA